MSPVSVKVEQARIVQRGVEGELPLLEIDDAEEVDLEVEDGDVLGRQRDAQHAEDREGRAAGSRG